MKGLFGGMFDFNHDGKLNSFERAAEMQFFDHIMSDKGNSCGISESNFDDLGMADEDDEREELEEAGLDLDELDMMDEEERREALEDAGVDPDDYEF